MKNIIIKFLKIFFYFLTIDYIFKKIIKNDFLILLYHDVSNKPSEFHKEEKITLTKNKFEEQINFIKKYYTFISPKEILKNKKNKTRALITFDDGMASYFENAVPFLLRNKIPSIHFLNLEPIKQKYFSSAFSKYLVKKKIVHNKNFINLKYIDLKKYLKNKKILSNVKKFHGRFATLKQVKKFEKSNLIFYGNHLYNHFNAANLTKKELEYYYQKNRKELKNFKNYIDFFSYPFGQKKINYNNFTDRFLSKVLNVKKIFYADTLSFNKFKNNFFHRMSLTDDMGENDFKKQIIYFKFKNFFLNFSG